MRLTLLLLLPLLASPAYSGPQDQERDPAKSIESYERYLARKPYHDWAFDKLVEVAVSINGLPELVQRYESAVAEDPDEIPAKVVLARLFAAADRLPEALEVLATLTDEGAQRHRLEGELLLRTGNWADAVAALDRAAAVADDPAALEEIHKERGQALLAAGERERAVEAFRALAAIDPESFHLRLEAASELAWHGLTAEALEEFAAADELAGDEVSKRCRVLSEIGRLHERLTQGDEALAVYRRAIDLMSRGNWLKRDLYDRVLSIHRRSGTLAELVAISRAEVEESSANLDAREFLARVLVASEDRDGARDVLLAAVQEFPSDLALSRRLLEVLGELEDDEGRIAEYQRILVHRPEELELYLELGKVLASSGRFEAAREQWNRTLETRLQDAGLCVRLAGFYALFDRAEDAVAMYEKAIALEPGDLRHYADLASFLAVRERNDEIPALLERADSAARGDAGRLGDVASLWSEYGEPARARQALEAAIAISGEDAHLLSRLADALVGEGQLERATDVLHDVVENATDSGLRSSAVDRLLRLFRVDDRTGELIGLEEARIAADPQAMAPRLVLAKLHVQRREPDLAIAAYQQLVELVPDSEDGHRALARLYEEAGDHSAALAQYDVLIATRPQTRRTYLKEIARIHLARLDQERAFECYEEILRGAPDNAAAFKEVADAYDQLGLHDRRLECLQQAVRLRPEDARYRLDLADAWRTRGEWDNARNEVEAAIASASDEDLREDARERLYVLLSETGSLEAEVESLRKRVEENPYDNEAPITLTDVYVRELEYELALEMLDRLLTFQPREPRLLEERARLYTLMERHLEAIADYETLWKLPDADRRRLAIDIADASLESGNLDRAAKVLAGQPDAAKVAALYREHDLPDEAISVLEKAIAGAPGDGKMLFTLARVQEQIGDRRGAAETLERLLALRGDSWRVLLKLGELHHDLGQKDEARAVGGRLFALVRVDDPVDDPDEEKNARKDPWTAANRYRYYYANQRVSQRLSALKTYFESKGQLDDFIALGTAEIHRQPTNDVLYGQVISALRSAGQRQEEARALVRLVREETSKSGRVPAGSTREAWELRLDRDEANLYSGNSSFASTQVEELQARVADGTASERDHRELAQLLGTLQRDADKLAALRAGVAAYPDSIALQAGLAVTLDGDKQFQEASEAYVKIVSMLDASDWRERERERLEHAFKAQKRNILQRFPVHVQRRVNDEVLRRVYDMTYGSSTALSWYLGSDPSLDGARMKLARCLLKLERTDEARAVLAALEPEESEYVRRWSDLAKMYYDEELYDEAEAIYVRLRDLDATLREDPVLGHNRTWSSTVNRVMLSYGRLQEKREELLEAYDTLRTYGHSREGELLLTTNELLDEAVERYRAERDAAARTLADEEADREPWREATVMLADVLQIQKHWDAVLALYEELAAELEDDFGVLNHIAALHKRAGRIDDTVATYHRIIDRKRELNRRMRRDEAPDPRRVFPTGPPVGGGAASMSRLSGLGYIGTSSVVFSSGVARPATRGSGGLYSLRADYMAILQLYLDRKDPKKAAEMLRRIAREDASSFRYMSWEVRQLIENHQLGAEGVPILRLMHSYNPDDDRTALEYGKVLVQAEKYDDAHKVLTRVANKGRRRWWTTNEAREQLDALEARMGLARRVTTEDLLASVEEDPKNVKTRMKLARRLLKDRRFEEALEQGRAAEELAPHLDEVSEFVTDALQVLDRRDELEGRLREKLDSTTLSEDKFVIAVRLADWMRERGEDREAIDALFDTVVERRWGGRIEYAPSSWYLQKGELDTAREKLTAEIEQMGEDASSSANARMRLTTLTLLQDDPTFGLSEAWKSFDKATARGARATALGRMAGVLRGLTDPAAFADELEAFVSQYDGMRAEMTRAAWMLAVGDVVSLEPRLDELSQQGEEYLFLYPVIVDLARQRGDLETALAYLRRLEQTNHPSKTRTVNTGSFRLSEYQALRAEIGSLLFETGDPDGALQIWSTLYEEEERELGRSTLASLYAMHDLRAEAAVLLREQLEDDGEKNASTMTRLADHELALGNPDEARRLLEKALILSGHSPAQRMRLAAIHREEGSLPAHFDELVAQAQIDPDDAGLARVVVQLAIELGRDDVALQTVERLSDRPDQAQALKPFLLRMRFLRGEQDAAIDLYEDLLQGNVEEYQRQRYGEQLALAFGRRGDVERAVAALERSVGDSGAQEAKAALTKLYVKLERFEEALVEADAELELAPRSTEGKVRRIEILVELDRSRDALEATFVALEDSAFSHQRARFRGKVASLAAQLDEEARLEAALVETPDDVSLLYRLGLVRCTQHRLAEAVAPLEAALAIEPAHQGAMHELWPCYRAADRTADAERVLLALMDVIDRERVLETETWYAQSTLADLHEETGELYLMRGDREGALAAWWREPGRRYRDVEAYEYSYYNSPLDGISSRNYWLERHDFQREYLADLRLYSSFENYNWEQFQASTFAARFRTGDVDGALEGIWKAIAEPGRGLVVDPGTSNTFYSSRGNDHDARWFTLGSLWREAGRFDELVERVRAELRATPEDPVMTRLLANLLSGDEHRDELVEIRRAELEEHPDDTSKKEALASALIRLGRYDEALPLLEECYRARISAIPEGSGAEYVSNSRGSRRGTPGKVRFQWSGGSSSISSTSYFSSSQGAMNLEVDEREANVRRQLMALCAKLGDVERARELESIELAMAMLRSWGAERVPMQLATSYAKLGLIDDAERLAQQALAQSDTWEDATYRVLVQQCREHGDEERVLVWARRWEQRLGARITENPFDANILAERARLRLHELTDLEGATEDIATMLQWDPRDSIALRLRAWIQFENGETQAAQGSFRESERLSLASGLHIGPDLHYGLGLVTAELEGVEAARPRLLRALAQGPEDRNASRARELLQ